MRNLAHRFTQMLAILALGLIPLDFLSGINLVNWRSNYRYGAYILLAWMFAIASNLCRRPQPATATPRIQIVRQLIHRLSFLFAIVSLLMIPIGIIIEATNWGEMSEGFLSAYFVYAWLWAIVSSIARPLPKSAFEPAQSIEDSAASVPSTP